MKKHLIILTGLLVFINALYGQPDSLRPEIHCKHFVYGYPYGAPKTNDLIVRDGYALSNNDDTKFADWICYRLDSASISGSGRPRNWKKDPDLDDNETLEPSDYKKASETLKTDRGHQAPLASLDGYDTYYEANYLSNITPQKSTLNQGVWKRLEEKVRSTTEKTGLIYVITGPLFERAMPPLPQCDEPHQVPSGYWKIIIHNKNPGNPEVVGFIFNQETPKDASIDSGLVSIDEIERRSGLDFFWTLDPEIEQKLEQSVNNTWIGIWF